MRISNATIVEDEGVEGIPLITEDIGFKGLPMMFELESVLIIGSSLV
jgi:hypothetical protein